MLQKSKMVKEEEEEKEEEVTTSGHVELRWS